jgi:MoaA/NifB/PqqE/SkfB family radical SAM enzyme
MDMGLFRTIADQIKEAGVEEVGLFLIGEPFMNFPLILKALKYLKEIGIPYVFLTSNASLALPKQVRELMEAGLDSLKWSCNVADDAQFSEIIDVPLKFFECAQENIKSAWEIREENGYTTKLYASSIKYDEAQTERMLPLLKSSILPYVDEFYWLPLYTMGGKAIDREAGAGLRPTAGNTGRLDNPVAPIPCWTLFTAGHILTDGRMTACCADGSGFWTVGDLNKQTFMQAWHSEEFQKLRQAHIDKNISGTKCEKCAMYGE